MYRIQNSYMLQHWSKKVAHYGQNTLQELIFITSYMNFILVQKICFQKSFSGRWETWSSRKVLPFWQYCRNKHFDQNWYFGQNWYFCQIDIFVKLIFSSKLIFLSKLIFSSKLTILSKSYFLQFHQLFLMTSSTIDSYINFWYFHQLFDQNIKCLFQ